MGGDAEMNTPKHLDAFELECILGFLGNEVRKDLHWDLSAAEYRRVRSRLTRFVLTHPDVTPRLARVFRRWARGLEMAKSA
jgi:hypothetical protein